MASRGFSNSFLSSERQPDMTLPSVLSCCRVSPPRHLPPLRRVPCLGAALRPRPQLPPPRGSAAGPPAPGSVTGALAVLPGHILTNRYLPHTVRSQSTRSTKGCLQSLPLPKMVPADESLPWRHTRYVTLPRRQNYCNVLWCIKDNRKQQLEQT